MIDERIDETNGALVRLSLTFSPKLDKLIRKILCKIGRHNWNHYQHCLVTHDSFEDEHKVVLAFKVCVYCAHSKLIHILE